MRRPVRVFVADDHPSIRENLRYLIDAEDDMRCIGVAKDGRECLAHCLELQPDVVVVDQEIPGLDGVTIARVLGRELPTVRVILYTLDSDICSVAQSFGAAACVTKDAPFEWLLSAIRHSVRAPEALQT